MYDFIVENELPKKGVNAIVEKIVSRFCTSQIVQNYYKLQYFWEVSIKHVSPFTKTLHSLCLQKLFHIRYAQLESLEMSFWGRKLGIF